MLAKINNFIYIWIALSVLYPNLKADPYYILNCSKYKGLRRNFQLFSFLCLLYNFFSMTDNCKRLFWNFTKKIFVKFQNIKYLLCSKLYRKSIPESRYHRKTVISKTSWGKVEDFTLNPCTVFWSSLHII